MSTVLQPKTRAGQFFRHENHQTIKERLTSYGSIAIVKNIISYTIVIYELDRNGYRFINCGYNTHLITSLWKDLV